MQSSCCCAVFYPPCLEPFFFRFIRIILAVAVDLEKIILEMYPLDEVEITFDFKDLYDEPKDWAKDRLHWGVDLKAYFVRCMAMAGGVVVRASRFDPTGWGKYVTIQHPGGYQTVYAHLSEVNVKEGQTVKAGEVIGITGDTGSADGYPHLHIELRAPGAPDAGPRGQLNPLYYIQAQSPDITPPPVFEPADVAATVVNYPSRWQLMPGRPYLYVRDTPSTATPLSVVGQLEPLQIVEAVGFAGDIWVKLDGADDKFCAVQHNGVRYLRELK